MEKMVADIMDNIRRVFQVMNEQSKLVERECGITGPQLWAVRIISENGALRVSDLARMMYLHPATVVGIVDRLEKRGILMRTRASDDRRVVEVSLTDSGRELAERSPEMASNKITRGLESIPREEVAVIHRGLDRLVSLLDASGIPPQLIGAPDINLPDPVRPGEAGSQETP